MNDKFDLQLFAEGGDGGAGSGGEGAAAQSAQPSEARLRELGVPEDRLQKRAKREAARKKDDGNRQPPLPQRGIPPLHKEGEEKPQPKGEGVKVFAGGRSYDIRSHYDGMNRQAAEMAARYPEFNLQKELDNPTFLRLTGPEIGLPLEDAYMAMHHRELTRAIAERSRQELSNSIRAGSARPVEHGMGAKAPSVVTFDYKNATKSQRAAFKKQIYDAAARGEKIYPSR